MSAKRDGTITTGEVEIGTVAKDEDQGVWIGTCGLCEESFADGRKDATVSEVEDHYEAAHVVPGAF